jgi:hypothetical protein
MLDWIAPWATYRIETEEVIDLGERVVVLNHDRGRREGSTHELEVVSLPSGPSATGRSPASMRIPTAPKPSKLWAWRDRRCLRSLRLPTWLRS